MKRTSLIASAAIVVLANAVALVHAARNRMGTPDAELTLTQRELWYYPSARDDDSGVALNLEWNDLGNFPSSADVKPPEVWLDRVTLQRLGFDCRVDPASPAAERFYQRQQRRRVFVALEYDGPAWRCWLEDYQHALAEQRAKQQFVEPGYNIYSRSHLMTVDADLDSWRLRGRHPDRTVYIIVPAVVSVRLETFPDLEGKGNSKRPARVVGNIQQLPSSIHVPRPFSDQFRRLKPEQRANANYREPSYRVRLRYGALLEPWITGVEFRE
jgi:uncharacterized protein DUF4824